MHTVCEIAFGTRYPDVAIKSHFALIDQLSSRRHEGHHEGHELFRTKPRLWPSWIFVSSWLKMREWVSA